MASQPNPRAVPQSQAELLNKIEELTEQVAYWQREAKLKDQRICEVLIDNDEMRQRLYKVGYVAAAVDRLEEALR